MFTNDIRVRGYRLALLSMRRDYLRELRGDYVTKSSKCSVLNMWSEDWQNRLFEVGEILGMATKPNNKVITGWKGFKDFRLTAEQLEGFASFDVDDDDLMDLIQVCLAEGYKLTLTYNGQSDTYNCAITCNAEKHKNEGYTMSAFAHSAYIAMKLLMYKHTVLLEGDWDNIPAPQKGGMG